MGRAAARGGSKCAAPLHPGARVGQAQCSFACRMRRERTCPDCEAIAHCRGSGSGYTRRNGGPQPGQRRARAGKGGQMSDDDLMPEIEATGARLVRAREMIARRIIGQQEVVEQTLIAILSGGHGLLVGAPGLAKTRLVETLGTVLGLVANRVQFTPDLMPADILGAEVLETGADGTPGVPLHRRADLLPAPDGRRDQPRQPAHPVGAVAGDAGEGGLGRGPAADPAEAVPRAGDAEPDRAGGHLSAARGAARPVPAADRRRLSRARRTSGRSSSRPPASRRRWPSRCSTPRA